MNPSQLGPDPAMPARHRAPRRALWGALLWIAGSVQFVLAMIVVQLAWTTPYDIWTNAVSDLGAVTCAENAMGTSYVCSPLHVVFNVSIILFGLCIAVGAVAVRPSLPSGRIGTAGVAVLIVAGIGAALVGIFPEDVQGVGHALGALLAFVGASVALILLGVAMSGEPRWARFRLLSLGCGIVSGGTIVVSSVVPMIGPLGFGGYERLIVAPALLWLLVVGTVLARAG